MKVLFIGEGPHDIGRSGVDPDRPHSGKGVIPTLARKVCPVIDEDFQALRWTEIVRFNSAAKKKGFEAKVAAAILVSSRKSGCAATVCVADQDRDPTRLPAMYRGRTRGLELVGGTHRAACGVAVESIEAWTLGAPEAIAAELGMDIQEVLALYPTRDVESLYERSGNAEHRPKALLERIANLQHRSDGREFRQAIAERTDIAALEKACPQGFKPFGEALRAAFDPQTS